ncbi:hypothetical protein GCM10009718_16080 [Isoptericola halotolerans]
MRATTAHLLGASEEMGVDTVLPRAIPPTSGRSPPVTAGDNWTAILEVIEAARHTKGLTPPGGSR